jgi:LmbE family N-acetylglucosaminyl deacetylase
MNNEVGLVLTPHMDDEVIGTGGTIANLVKSGYQVVVYLTDGAAAYEGNVSETKTILLKAQVGSGRGLRRSGVR